MFLGVSFFGGADALPLTPTNATNDTYVGVTRGLYDNIYVTRKPDIDIDTTVNGLTWDTDTIMNATFENKSLSASNINYITKTVNLVFIKRREKGTYNWMTIQVKRISDIKDINVTGIDYMAGGNRVYEYALVPAYMDDHGIIQEGAYNISSITSSFDGAFVVEKNKIYGTAIDTTYNSQRNAPSNTVELFNHKYPKYVRNTLANYDSGTVTGEFTRFIPCESMTEAGGQFDFYNNFSYRKAFKDFLMDGKPKVLKVDNGDMWLVNIVDAPTDQSSNDISFQRTISFNWVECGDVTSEQDLYLAGISDIDRRWWSTNV